MSQSAADPLRSTDPRHTRQHANLVAFAAAESTRYAAFKYRPWTTGDWNTKGLRLRLSRSIRGTIGVFAARDLAAKATIAYYPGLLMTHEMHNLFNDRFRCPTAVNVPLLDYSVDKATAKILDVKERDPRDSSKFLVRIVLVGDPRAVGALLNSPRGTNRKANCKLGTDVKVVAQVAKSKNGPIAVPSNIVIVERLADSLTIDLELMLEYDDSEAKPSTNSSFWKQSAGEARYCDHCFSKIGAMIPCSGQTCSNSRHLDCGAAVPWFCAQHAAHRPRCPQAFVDSKKNPSPCAPPVPRAPAGSQAPATLLSRLDSAASHSQTGAGAGTLSRSLPPRSTSPRRQQAFLDAKKNPSPYAPPAPRAPAGGQAPASLLSRLSSTPSPVLPASDKMEDVAVASSSNATASSVEKPAPRAAASAASAVAKKAPLVDAHIESNFSYRRIQAARSDAIEVSDDSCDESAEDTDLGGSSSDLADFEVGDPADVDAVDTTDAEDSDETPALKQMIRTLRSAARPPTVRNTPGLALHTLPELKVLKVVMSEAAQNQVRLIDQASSRAGKRENFERAHGEHHLERLEAQRADSAPTPEVLTQASKKRVGSLADKKKMMLLDRQWHVINNCKCGGLRVGPIPDFASAVTLASSRVRYRALKVSSRALVTEVLHFIKHKEFCWPPTIHQSMRVQSHRVCCGCFFFALGWSHTGVYRQIDKQSAIARAQTMEAEVAKATAEADGRTLTNLKSTLPLSKSTTLVHRVKEALLELVQETGQDMPVANGAGSIVVRTLPYNTLEDARVAVEAKMRLQSDDSFILTSSTFDRARKQLEDHSQVGFRAKKYKAQGRCTKCEKWQNLIKEARRVGDGTALEDAQRAFARHTRQWQEQRQLFEQKKVLALREPWNLNCCTLDGMDQAKTDMPHYARHSKAAFSEDQLGVRVVGGFYYGGNVPCMAFTTLPNTQGKGAGASISVFERMIDINYSAQDLKKAALGIWAPIPSDDEVKRNQVRAADVAGEAAKRVAQNARQSRTALRSTSPRRQQAFLDAKKNPSPYAPPAPRAPAGGQAPASLLSRLSSTPSPVLPASDKMEDVAVASSSNATASSVEKPAPRAAASAVAKKAAPDVEIEPPIAPSQPDAPHAKEYEAVDDNGEAANPATSPLFMWPEGLHATFDNTAADCKNKTFFRFLGCLVGLGVFMYITVSNLMVGHTHDIVDQMFSVWAQQLRNADAKTMEQLHALFRKKYSTHIYALRELLKNQEKADTNAGNPIIAERLQKLAKEIGFKPVIELMKYCVQPEGWCSEPANSKNLAHLSKPHVFYIVKESVPKDSDQPEGEQIEEVAMYTRHLAKGDSVVIYPAEYRDKGIRFGPWCARTVLIKINELPTTDPLRVPPITVDTSDFKKCLEAHRFECNNLSEEEFKTWHDCIKEFEKDSCELSDSCSECGGMCAKLASIGTIKNGKAGSAERTVANAKKTERDSTKTKMINHLNTPFVPGPGQSAEDDPHFSLILPGFWSKWITRVAQVIRPYYISRQFIIVRTPEQIALNSRAGLDPHPAEMPSMKGAPGFLEHREDVVWRLTHTPPAVGDLVVVRSFEPWYPFWIGRVEAKPSGRSKAVVKPKAKRRAKSRKKSKSYAEISDDDVSDDASEYSDDDALLEPEEIAAPAAAASKPAKSLTVAELRAELAALGKPQPSNVLKLALIAALVKARVAPAAPAAAAAASSIPAADDEEQKGEADIPMPDGIDSMNADALRSVWGQLAQKHGVYENPAFNAKSGFRVTELRQAVIESVNKKNEERRKRHREDAGVPAAKFARQEQESSWPVHVHWYNFSASKKAKDRDLACEDKCEAAMAAFGAACVNSWNTLKAALKVKQFARVPKQVMDRWVDIGFAPVPSNRDSSVGEREGVVERDAVILWGPPDKLCLKKSPTREYKLQAHIFKRIREDLEENRHIAWGIPAAAVEGLALE